MYNATSILLVALFVLLANMCKKDAKLDTSVNEFVKKISIYCYFAQSYTINIDKKMNIYIIGTMHF